MQRRHWDRISELVGRELDYESDQFSMKSILECDLYKHREDIEVSQWLRTTVHIQESIIIPFLAKQLFFKRVENSTEAKLRKQGQQSIFKSPLSYPFWQNNYFLRGLKIQRKLNCGGD